MKNNINYQVITMTLFKYLIKNQRLHLPPVLILGLLILTATPVVFAQSLPLSCNSTADDVWAVYQQGVTDKIGDIVGGSHRWKEGRITNMDAEVLGQTWYATGDYSAKKQSSNEAGNASLRAFTLEVTDKIRQIVVKRCSVKTNDPCAEFSSGPAECVEFYDARYKPIFQRLKQAKEEVQASPYTNHVNYINDKVEQDFGIKASNLIILGRYVVIDETAQRNKIEDYPFEQANLQAVEQSRQRSQTNISLTRGEFEKLEDFNKRLEKNRSNPIKNNDKTSSSFKYYFEKALNLHSILAVDKTSIKYDPDTMQFTITIMVEGSNLKIPMSINVPIEEGQTVKKYLQNMNNPEQIYLPWLVFDFDGKALRLRGGYIMLVSAENKQAYKMLPIVSTPLTVAAGAEAASKFKPLLTKKLQEKLNKEQMEADARNQKMCSYMRSAIALNHPEYYYSATAAMGCQ